MRKPNNCKNIKRNAIKMLSLTTLICMSNIASLDALAASKSTSTKVNVVSTVSTDQQQDELDETNPYIMTEDLQPTIGYVNSKSGVIVRQGPGSDYEAVRTAEYGESVEYNGKTTDGWLRLSEDKYIHSDYIQSDPVPPLTRHIGRFRLTAYCNCSICNGKWAGGPTKSGSMPIAGRTIAVDPRVIPLGTKVIIDGHEYTAEDTGSAIKNQRIDMYFNNHADALRFGVQYRDVYVYN